MIIGKIKKWRQVTMRKWRNIRIEEVHRESGKVRRGQTLWSNQTEKELRDWYYPETEKFQIRVTELN